MSEYNLSKILDAEDLGLLSGSRFELGADAAQITWKNCLAEAADWGDSIGLDYEEIRKYFAEYGAWTRAELAAFSECELQAMVIQETAACLREMEDELWSAEVDGRNVHLEGENVWFYV